MLAGMDHPAARHLIPHKFGRHAFPLGDELHLFGNPALTGIVNLRTDAVVSAPRYPFGSHTGLIIPGEHSGGIGNRNGT